MSIPSISGSRLLPWVAKTVPTSCPASATHGGVSLQDPLCKIPLSNQSRVPNFQAEDWYLLVRSAAAFRLDIKCRIIVMCLTHPKTIFPNSLSMEKLSSVKLVCGAKKFGDCCSKPLVSLSLSPGSLVSRLGDFKTCRVQCNKISFQVSCSILRFIWKSEIAGSYGSYILIFWVISVLFSIVIAPVYILTNSAWIPFSSTSSAILICYLFDNSHSNGHEIETKGSHQLAQLNCKLPNK